jgi:hypothetical protein
MPHIEVMACIDKTTIMQWAIGKPVEWYHRIRACASRTSTALLTREQWTNVVLTRFLITTLEKVRAVRRWVPNTNNVGHADDDVDIDKSKNPRGMKRQYTVGSKNPCPNIARMLPCGGGQGTPKSTLDR